MAVLLAKRDAPATLHVRAYLSTGRPGRSGIVFILG
jgi:hypothetical protein